jgi:hypothetical protein
VLTDGLFTHHPFRIKVLGGNDDFMSNNLAMAVATGEEGRSSSHRRARDLADPAPVEFRAPSAARGFNFLRRTV